LRKETGRSGINVAVSGTVAGILQGLMIVVVSGATANIFCFVYIAVISMPAFYISIAVTAVCVLYYLVMRGTTERDMLEALKQESSFLDYIGHIIDGFKEVKVNTKKSDDLFDNHIKARANETRDLKVKSERHLVDIYSNNFAFSCEPDQHQIDYELE
jgi:putative ATP-binding cassette transporter